MIDSLPEYTNFFDPHLNLILIEFYQNNKSQNLLNSKKANLLKTLLFQQQEKFLNENKDFSVESDVNLINENKAKVEKDEGEIKQKIVGFLNLLENFRKNNDYEATSSISKKILEETPYNKVLEYGKLLYNTGKYDESLCVLSDFVRLCSDNRKNLSKVILALWNIFSINIIQNKWSEAFNTVEQLKNTIEILREYYEEDFKKINIESTDRLQFDFKQILIHRGYLIHWGLFLLVSDNETRGLLKFLDIVFNERFYSFIETSFNYLYKYLIVFSIISKSNKYIKTIKNSLSSISYEDSFTKLFLAICRNFNMENSFSLLNECLNEMENDFFLHKYKQSFSSKCKELLLENYILLNNNLNLNEFASFYSDNSELNGRDIKSFSMNFIRLNHPDAEIEEKDGVISYKFTSSFSENKHVLKAKELFDVTANMIELLKFNKNIK